MAAALVAAWEAYHMLRSRGHRPALLLGLATCGLLAIAPNAGQASVWFRATILVGTMVAGLWFLFAPTSYDAFLDWALTVVVAVYVGGLLGNLIALRNFHDGVRIVLLVLALTWAYDTGAYFIGRGFGVRPFMRKVSQSKTWEGVLGGFALTLVVALGCAAPARVGLLTATVLAPTVAVAAQTGDLVESLMKRYAKVKDSGRIIPGHGGLLDRIDSLFFTGTAAYYVLLASGYH